MVKYSYREMQEVLAIGVILKDIQTAIDTLDIQQLWHLCVSDPRGVINKISIRQLGKKRMDKLYAYLVALDKDQLLKKHAFEMLLLVCCENELGTGLFKKGVGY